MRGEVLEFYQSSYAQPDSVLEGQPYTYPVETEATMQMGSNFGPAPQGFAAAFGSGGLEGEPPLLQELGINFDHILRKTFAVLNPTRGLEREILDDDDLAGPLLFCLLFGSCLLLAGKVHFSYIYGVALLGCVGLYTILNLMSDGGINGTRTASILGYCLLPMVLLAIVSAVVQLNGWIGFVLASLTVMWCAFSSSTMFVTVLNMSNQRPLIAYPIVLLYASFALMAVF